MLNSIRYIFLFISIIGITVGFNNHLATLTNFKFEANALYYLLNSCIIIQILFYYFLFIKDMAYDKKASYKRIFNEWPKVIKIIIILLFIYNLLLVFFIFFRGVYFALVKNSEYSPSITPPIYVLIFSILIMLFYSTRNLKNINFIKICENGHFGYNSSNYCEKCGSPLILIRISSLKHRMFSVFHYILFEKKR